MKSQALVLEQPKSAPSVVEVDVDHPAPGEVLVRIVASGICGTDGHAVEGSHPLPHLPIVLGHEGAGVIEEVGANVTSLAPGDHVVLALSVACGTCRQCHRGLPFDCNGSLRRQAILGIMDDGKTRVHRNGTTLYPFFGVGTLSQYTTVRQEQAVRIDRDLPLDEFCLAGCGVATGIGAALNVAKVQVGDTVVVVGCGGVGVNVIQGARIAGASMIIAIDPVKEKLDLAIQLGATHVTNATAEAAEFVARVEPDGADVVFEVVGRPELVADCLKLTRVGGTCVMVGIPPAGTTIPVESFALVGNRRLLGCRGGAVMPHRDIDRLATLYRGGQIRLAELIGQRLELSENDRGFADLGSSTFARSIVTFS